MKTEIRQTILDRLSAAKKQSKAEIAVLQDTVSLTDYRHLTRQSEWGTIWTSALQTALEEHEVVVIPPAETIYYLDSTIVIPSNRRIEAGDAIICMIPVYEKIMLRNQHTQDGSDLPPLGYNRDRNISINGGIWRQMRTERGNYGTFGAHDDPEIPYHGVYAGMFFNHVDGLSLTDMTLSHIGAFSIQIDSIRGGFFENLIFDHGFVDGLHVNGCCEQILIRHIRGSVGDDLVALNMYDWARASVGFGPIHTLLCEDVEPEEGSAYKAFRILPGTYTYKDGTKRNCSLSDAIIRNIRGVQGFKLYMQTPAYVIGTQPETGEIGSLDNVFIEDIEIDLAEPVDKLNDYICSDPLRGHFGAFELNAETGYLCLDNIRLTLHRDRYPLSHFLCIGPKSARNGDIEVFNPYLSSTVSFLECIHITVNGFPVEAPGDLIHITHFQDVNKDGNSTGSGNLKNLFWKS